MIPFDPRLLDWLPLWRHMLAFAVVHFWVAVPLGLLLWLVDATPPSGLGAIVILAAGYAAARRFTGQHKRYFTRREMWTLIAGCALYMALFEGFTLWANLDSMPSRSLPVLGGVLAIALAFDLLFLWLAFRFALKKFFEGSSGGDGRAA